MTDPQPFYLAKDDQSVHIGKSSEILYFKFIPIEGDSQQIPVAGDSYDPTIPMEESLMLPSIFKDFRGISLVIHSEPPTDFHRQMESRISELSKRASFVDERVRLKESVRKMIKKKNDIVLDERESEKRTDICRHFQIRQGENLIFEERCRLHNEGGWINGRVYIFDNYVAFTGTFFVNRISFVCRTAQITEIIVRKKTLSLKGELRDLEMKFSSLELVEVMKKMINQQLQEAKLRGSNDLSIGNPIESQGETLEEKGLSEDWKLLLKGAKVRCYERDSVILSEGQITNGLYQISYGTVRIVKYDANTKQGIPIARIPSGEIFGEMSFLTTGASGKGGAEASASVIADDEVVDIYFISKEYIQKAFQTRKGLGGRFYHYLATCLAQRFYNTALKLSGVS
jgi:CRP-like cAMP-binding protein